MAHNQEVADSNPAPASNQIKYIIVKNIGITGTRNGLTDFQRSELTSLLKVFREEFEEFHHGDCVGVDVQAAKIAKDHGYSIIGHPPSKTNLRGFFESDVNMAQFGYLERDRNIVNAVDLLIVCPKENDHQDIGGTWYTHDYAVKKNVNRIIIYPNRVECNILDN